MPMDALAGITWILSCPQPWACVTVEGPRRVHNLTSRPPSALLGQLVGIYAAGLDTATAGQALALLDAAGIGHAQRANWSTPKVTGGVIGTARVTGIVTEDADPWFVGPFALALDDRRRLPTPISLPPKPHAGPWAIWRLP